MLKPSKGSERWENVLTEQRPIKALMIASEKSLGLLPWHFLDIIYASPWLLIEINKSVVSEMNILRTEKGKKRHRGNYEQGTWTLQPLHLGKYIFFSFVDKYTRVIKKNRKSDKTIERDVFYIYKKIPTCILVWCRFITPFNSKYITLAKCHLWVYKT